MLKRLTLKELRHLNQRHLRFLEASGISSFKRVLGQTYANALPSKIEKHVCLFHNRHV